MSNNDALEKELEARWRKVGVDYHLQLKKEKKRRWKFNLFLIALWLLMSILLTKVFIKVITSAFK